MIEKTEFQIKLKTEIASFEIELIQKIITYINQKVNNRYFNKT